LIKLFESFFFSLGKLNHVAKLEAAVGSSSAAAGAGNHMHVILM